MGAGQEGRSGWEGHYGADTPVVAHELGHVHDGLGDEGGV